MTQKKTAKLIEFPRNRRARRDRHRVGGELADLRAEALRQRFRKAEKKSPCFL